MCVRTVCLSFVNFRRLTAGAKEGMDMVARLAWCDERIHSGKTSKSGALHAPEGTSNSAENGRNKDDEIDYGQHSGSNCLTDAAVVSGIWLERKRMHGEAFMDVDIDKVASV